MSTSDIRFYVDTLIVETALGNPTLFKAASSAEQAESSVATMVKNYIGSHIDQNDKVGSFLNILAPAVVFGISSFFGFPKWGAIFALAMDTFHIDVSSMLEPILSSVKDSLTSGKTVTPDQIDQAVAQTVQQHSGDDSSPADDMLGHTVAQDLREARRFRLALGQYEQHMLRLTKDPAPVPGFLASYAAAATKGGFTSFLGRMLGWAFKAALISGGFMVAGDLAARMFGMPSALNGTYQAGQKSDTSGAPAASAGPVTTQKKYPLIPGQDAPHPQPWVENVTNDPGSIENMLVDFTKQVYSGLDGHEEDIRSSPTFQAVKSQIAWYNQSAAGRLGVYIPKNYPSKQAIVDHYIDEVAKASS
jgi:hypothetical protein